jgi:hypothetical protein
MGDDYVEQNRRIKMTSPVFVCPMCNGEIKLRGQQFVDASPALPRQRSE